MQGMTLTSHDTHESIEYCLTHNGSNHYSSRKLKHDIANSCRPYHLDSWCSAATLSLTALESLSNDVKFFYVLSGVESLESDSNRLV